jgi:la-related protein 1
MPKVGQIKYITPMPKFEPRIHQTRKVIITEKMRETLNHLKQDLVETPISKNKYKILSRDLKETEKKGFSEAIRLVFERIITLPKKVHWKILLDLADYAKRESRFNEAKMLFKLIAYIQPFAYQGWLEFAKMEEECGN